MKRIPTLDGWRGVAILLVLLEHFQPRSATGLAYPALQYVGIHGVSVFFVLSGYLITSKLRSEFEARGSLDLRGFYTRRFFRLMPCAWAYLLVLAAFHALTVREAAGCVFFYRNFVVIPQVGLAPHFLTNHFWSLSIEEQFYLCWPAILLLSLRRGWRVPFTVALVAACGVAAWRFSMHGELLRAAITRTFQTQYRADALLIGCATALLPRVRLRPRMERGLLLAALLGLFLCVLYIRRITPLGESILIALCIRGTVLGAVRLPARILEFRPLAHVGTISYSIYVWQQAVSAFESRSLWGMAVRVAAALAIAHLSYYGLERPMIRWGKKTLRSETLEPEPVAP